MPILLKLSSTKAFTKFRFWHHSVLMFPFTWWAKISNIFLREFIFNWPTINLFKFLMKRDFKFILIIWTTTSVSACDLSSKLGLWNLKKHPLIFYQLPKVKCSIPMCFRIDVFMFQERQLFVTHLGKLSVYLHRFVIIAVVARYYAGYTNWSRFVCRFLATSITDFAILSGGNSEFTIFIRICSITWSGSFSQIQGFI